MLRISSDIVVFSLSCGAGTWLLLLIKSVRSIFISDTNCSRRTSPVLPLNEKEVGEGEGRVKEGKKEMY